MNGLFIEESRVFFVFFPITFLQSLITIILTILLSTIMIDRIIIIIIIIINKKLINLKVYGETFCVRGHCIPFLVVSV